MGIYSALSIGNTALLASQKALEVVGNNIANAATPNYSRQDVILVPGQAVGSGIKVGTGVQVQSVIRRYDAAVESRLRHATADARSLYLQKQALDRVESLFGEMTDYDLSTSLVNFFNSFSDLATDPQDMGVRTIAVEQANALVHQIHRLRDGMDDLRVEIDGAVQTTVDEINRLSQQVADLNVQVILSEEGRLDSAPSLRDQRDATLRKLSGLVDIRCIEQNSGVVNVIVGNQILVDGRYARTLGYETVENQGVGVSEIRFTDNNELVSLTGGELQGYIYARDTWIGQQVSSLDTLARSLIFEVNKIHAEGTGTTLPQIVRSGLVVSDKTANLNSLAAGFENTPVNGSFLLHLTNINSGMTETLTVDVDLDGLGADDSLEDVVNRINTLAGLQVPPLNVIASIDTTNHLVIQGTSAEMRVSFSDDTSDLLACLGMNSLLSGYDSLTIGVSADVQSNPGLLAVSLSGDAGDNANALRLAGLADTSLTALGSVTLLEYHKQAATRLAVNTAASTSASTTANIFLSAISDEREAISGVNLDEEAVKLIRYQKLYTAAAKYMSTMSELLDQLLEI
jgi:flagellar hook-associated protein 1